MDRLESLSRLAGRIVPSCRIPSDLTGMVSVEEAGLVAYHAVSSGFILAEVVQRATGSSIREG